MLAFSSGVRTDKCTVWMLGCSLLMYKAEEGVIEDRARDYHANWLTAVEVLDDDTFLAAENSFNLITLHKNADATTDEERSKLEVLRYDIGLPSSLRNTNILKRIVLFTQFCCFRIL